MSYVVRHARTKCRVGVLMLDLKPGHDQITFFAPNPTRKRFWWNPEEPELAVPVAAVTVQVDHDNKTVLVERAGDLYGVEGFVLDA
jgi:hypothetical protein